MNTSRSERSRPIKADEIAAWYGTFLKPVLTAEQFDALANSINGWLWPRDENAANACTEQEAVHCKHTKEAAYLWDFEKVTEAARTLLDNFAAVQSLRKRLMPNDHDALDALEQLKISLIKTMPMIEFPFGPVHTRPRPPNTSKPWRTYALALSLAIIPEMTKAGLVKISISKNSVLVRIIREVMLRMKIPGAHVTDSAISALLIEFDRYYGLTPQGVGALTTNKTRNFFALVAQS
jgi:hypothetical protein